MLKQLISKLFGSKKSETGKEGTVKFFNNSKGFGFIAEKDSDKEHFVHVTGLKDKIREGHKVSFDLQEGDKGLNAVNVKRIK
jgi:CspA family cold shock protein